MSVLNVENISYGFGSRKILEDVTFRLLKGEHVGLVGANGEGKTTFLNIVTGKLMPDEGSAAWGKNIKTGYLDQSSTLQKGKSIRDILRQAFEGMYIKEKDMLLMYERMAEASEEELALLLEEVGDLQEMLEHNGFYRLDSRIEEYANGLGLGEIGLDTAVDDLSGGQRAKVLLAKLLLENPDILLLDEPTNFLDENHITWLIELLRNYDNAFIVISHDESFLRAVINVVYHVENATLTRYKGDYDNFLMMSALKKRQLEQAYDRQQKEISDLEDFIARNKARIATANMAKSRQKKLDKMDVIELGKKKLKPTFSFELSRTPGKIVFEAKHLILGYDEPLTSPLNLQLERGQKVAVKGVNGVGKSTLLKTLMGILPPIEGEVDMDPFVEIGYFEQEKVVESNTALEEVWNEFPAMTNAEVRRALAKCGLTAEHIGSQMKVLSGGENAKVRLCKLMLRSMNLLVLDEPTNHLDLDAKEALKKALLDFKGTLLLVSHEPDFYSDIVSQIWNLEEWTTKVV